jgi:ketosteroid isomerase-like protein
MYKVTLLIALLSTSVFSQSIEKQLLETEKQLAKAIVDGDTTAVASLVADEYTFTVPEGSDISKKQFLLDMKKFWHPFSQIHSQQKVKVNGKTAVVSGLVEFKWGDKNNFDQAAERYTDTYVLQKGKWRKYASHAHPEYPTKETLEREVQQTLETLWKAWETSDRELAEPIYDMDFMDTDFEGTRRSRAEVLDFLNPLPANQTAKITLSDWRFIVMNNVVVANYVGEDIRTTNGKSSSWRFRATDTLVRKYGKWKLVAGQQILIKGKP